MEQTTDPLSQQEDVQPTELPPSTIEKGLSNDSNSDSIPNEDPQSNALVVCEPSEVTNRVILLIGPQGNGKRSICNKICGKDLFNLPTDFEAAIQKPKKYIKKATQNGVKYSFFVFDSELTNLAYHINSIGEMVHLVLFVQKAHESSSTGNNVIRLLDEHPHLQKILDISALVFTFSEYLNETKKNELRDRYIHTHGLKLKKGYHFVSFPQVSSLPDELVELFKPVIQEDANKLHNLCKDSNEMMPIHLPQHEHSIFCTTHCVII